MKGRSPYPAQGKSGVPHRLGLLFFEEPGEEWR